jgi:hypothetical protein
MSKTFKKVLAAIALVILVTAFGSLLSHEYLGDWRVAPIFVGALIAAIAGLYVIGLIFWLIDYLNK